MIIKQMKFFEWYKTPLDLSANETSEHLNADPNPFPLRSFTSLRTSTKRRGKILTKKNLGSQRQRRESLCGTTGRQDPLHDVTWEVLPVDWARARGRSFRLPTVGPYLLRP